MGYYVFNGATRTFVEDDKPVPAQPAPPVTPPLLPPIEVFAPSDPLAQESPVAPEGEIEHFKKCRSKGRGGKYTEGCPKCEELRNK